MLILRRVQFSADPQETAQNCCRHPDRRLALGPLEGRISPVASVSAPPSSHGTPAFPAFALIGSHAGTAKRQAAEPLSLALMEKLQPLQRSTHRSPGLHGRGGKPLACGSSGAVQRPRAPRFPSCARSEKFALRRAQQMLILILAFALTDGRGSLEITIFHGDPAERYLLA